ncbi:hypothetical protein EG68_07635 [Paragonimus skrjabini miyazakii]|uniref:WD repeat domain-containing protein 83 n=1 Tax=Paragonimus skrjabini miyazakii TaxID=59628 RepID=A0A8S9YRC7_9TREM|nr:hypothetical protein EG68_07635 [Paragonimus skrjabini miyazakii]
MVPSAKVKPFLLGHRDVVHERILILSPAAEDLLNWSHVGVPNVLMHQYLTRRFNLGVKTTVTTTGTSGFSFSSPAFGTPSTTNPNTTTGLFGGSATTSALGGGLFGSGTTGSFNFGLAANKSFGTTTTTTSSTVPQSAVTTASGFGLPSTTTTSAFGSLFLPSVTSTTTNAFSFGLQAAKPATANFGSFSAASSTPAVSTTSSGLTGFSFGIQTIKPQTTNTFGQSVSTSSSTPSPGFQLQTTTGATTTTAPAVTAFGSLNTVTSQQQQSCVSTATPSSALLSTTLFKPAAATNLGSVSQSPGTQFTTTYQSQAATSVVTSVSQSTTPAAGFTLSFPTVTSSSTDASKPATSVPFGKVELPATKPATTSSPTLWSLPVSSTVAATAVSTATTNSIGLTSLMATTATTAVSSTQPSSVLSAMPKTSTMTYHQLEELVNRWAHELEEQERYFMDEADRINQWDQVLLNNGEKITALYEKVDSCKTEQTQLEQELDFIEGQQRELENLLEPLERAANELPPGQLHSDFEREAIFQLATNVDLELGQLLSDLREMADQVNATSSTVTLTTVTGDADSQKSADGSSGPGRALLACKDESGVIHQLMSKTGRASEQKPARLPTQASRRLHCHQSAVRAARFNSDGLYCVTAGGDKTIKLWNPYTNRLLKTYTGHGGEVADVQAGADNSQLGSGGADCMVILWDVSTGQSVRRWRRHAGRVNAVRFAAPFQHSETGLPSPILLSAGMDGMVLVWDARARTPYPVQTMHEAKDSVTCVSFARWQIVTGSVDRCVRIYDIRRGEMTEDYVGYPVTSVSMTMDCQCLLVGTQDSTLRLFDALNGELLNKYTGHVNQTYRMDSVLMNFDAHIASGSEDQGIVFIWDFVRSNAPILTLDHTPGGPVWGDMPDSGGPVSQLAIEAAKCANFLVHSLSAHPTQSKLLTAGGDFVWLWDAEPDETEEAEDSQP